jgi:hypothetical protein
MPFNENKNRLVLIPQPKECRILDGRFDCNRTDFHISPPDNGEVSGNASGNLQQFFEKLLGRKILLAPGIAGAIKLVIATAQKTADEESYRIDIKEDTIRISACTATGLFRGTTTLAQIVCSCGTMIPCLAIADSPDFPARGFYHDVTRGKVPTLATLKSLVDKLAFYKINQLQLYIEHAFAFKAIPELWAGRDPLTADEIVELDAYCRESCIELVPSLATFGHLYELLRLPRFEHLNELDIRASQLPHDLWERMAHYTIDVSNSESTALIRSMIDEFAPLFSSKRFNICCDETFDLGKGKNRDKAARVGVGRLYVDFVKKIISAVRDNGKSPMLWGDIVLHYPELISELPDNAVFLNWAYGADVTSEATATFQNAGVEQYVCPGVTGWSRFANDIDVASNNIRAMIGYGRRYGASGVLNTDWGDCGHVNFLANSMHSMILGAALSWNSTSFTNDPEFDEAVSRLEWNAGAVAENLRELGSLCFYHFGNLYAWVNHTQGLWNKEKEIQSMSIQELSDKYYRAGVIADYFLGLKGVGNFSGNVQDLDEFIWSARAIRWTLSLISYKKIHEFGQRDCPALYTSKEELLQTTNSICMEFTKLWRARNRESELQNVIDVFGKITIRIRELV